MIFFVAVFALPQVFTIERRTLEVVSKAVKEADLVVVDIMRSRLGLVQHHCLFKFNQVLETGGAQL